MRHRWRTALPKTNPTDQFNFNWEGAGIAVMGSRDTEVFANTVNGNAAGITLIEDGRRWSPSAPDNGCYYELRRVRVGSRGLNDVGSTTPGTDRNLVTQPTGIAAGFFFGQEAQQQDNKYEDNDYVLPALNTPAFNWWQCSCDNRVAFGPWQGFGQDVTGSVTVG